MVQLYDKSGRAVTVSSSDTVTMSANVQGATTFMMVPCRALTTVPDSPRRRCVSLMDANRADWYVRHRGYYLYVHSENQTEDLPLFQADSSFLLHTNTFYSGYYALESVNYPDYYIKPHVNGRLKITRKSQTTDYYDTASFRIYYSNSSSEYDGLIGCLLHSVQYIRTFWFIILDLLTSVVAYILLFDSFIVNFVAWLSIRFVCCVFVCLSVHRILGKV